MKVGPKSSLRPFLHQALQFINLPCILLFLCYCTISGMFVSRSIDESFVASLFTFCFFCICTYREK